MYSNDFLDLSWGAQLTMVRLVLLSQFTMILISIVRFVRSSRGLYRSSGGRILPDDVLKGKADPDLLALEAFAGRLPYKAVSEKNIDAGLSKECISSEKVHNILLSAEIRFVYLWERCCSD